MAVPPKPQQMSLFPAQGRSGAPLIALRAPHKTVQGWEAPVCPPRHEERPSRVPVGPQGVKHKGAGSTGSGPKRGSRRLTPSPIFPVQASDSNRGEDILTVRGDEQGATAVRSPPLAHLRLEEPGDSPSRGQTSRLRGQPMRPGRCSPLPLTSIRGPASSLRTLLALSSPTAHALR